MRKIMYIKASPRDNRSHSRAVARAFLSALTKRDPKVEILERDLHKMELPPFDGLTIKGKYNIMNGRDFSPQEEQAWRAVEELIVDFRSADAYVFAVPMWNFNLPYRLKHYIDVITQPTYTFAVGENGYEGLVTGAPAFVAYSSGGVYPEIGDPAEHWNFQATYMRAWLAFIGITDVREVAARGMLLEGRAQSKEQAIAKAEAMAKEF